MIELAALSRVFDTSEGRVVALEAVDFSMGRQDYVSLVGPSGAGKSTLLKLLGFLDRPTSGSYRLNGIDTTQLEETELARTRNEQIGFVFQSAHFVEHLSLLDNVALPGTYGSPIADAEDRAAGLLARVGLGHRLLHRPAQLSGGERQRGALARALLRRPALLLADEPTGNLDEVNAGRVAELLEEFNAEGFGILLVTHDQQLAARAARRCRLMQGGIEE
jgi:putative ABC transport system ATP-binding protein